MKDDNDNGQSNCRKPFNKPEGRGTPEESEKSGETLACQMEIFYQNNPISKLCIA